VLSTSFLLLKLISEVTVKKKRETFKKQIITLKKLHAKRVVCAKFALKIIKERISRQIKN
jgi:hypothetical protein